MKKSIILTLALVFVLGIAGTAFAANPFVDVPAKHWAYDAVAKLAQAGIVDGYGDGTFKGDKTMTRYEMAQIVAKAMARADKANAEQKAAIDKLSVEFSTELNNMGVRVAALEKKAAADRLNFGGEVRLRYENKTENSVSSAHDLTAMLRIDANAKINDEWTANMRWEGYRDFRNDKGYGAGTYNSATGQAYQGNYDIVRAYVTGPIAGATLNAGKFGVVPGTGLTFDDNATGANLQFGNALKVTLGAVEADANVGTNNGKLQYGQLNYNFSKVTSAVGSYQQWVSKVGGTNINIWDLGVNSKLSNDWAVYGSYAKANVSNGNDQNKGYVFGFKYLNADVNKANSWDAWVNYEYMGSNVNFDTTYNLGGDKKGYVIGVDYVLAKNVASQIRYIDYKKISNTDVKGKQYRAQVEFFF